MSATVKNFLNYVDSGTVAGSFIQTVKSNQKVRMDFMTYEMTLLDRELLGEERGRSEGHVEMVKNFLAVGAPMDLIIKATGWSEDKIRQVQNSPAPNQM